MAKDAVSDWDTTAANNTDVGNINIAENCSASNINNALREMMAQLKARDNAVADALVAAAPPGIVDMFARNSPPTGWLKANGAELSRTTYATLWAEAQASGNLAASEGAKEDGQYGPGDGSTTFTIPDARGAFLRAWDDSRGIDSGRSLGSLQTDQNKSHTHTGTTDEDGEHTHTGSTDNDTHNHENSRLNFLGSGGNIDGVSGGEYDANSVPTLNDTHNHTLNINSGGLHDHTFTTDADGGSEARPRNIALLACIKF